MKEKRDVEEVVKRQIILHKNGQSEINIILLLRFDFFLNTVIYTRIPIFVYTCPDRYISNRCCFLLIGTAALCE